MTACVLSACSKLLRWDSFMVALDTLVAMAHICGRYVMVQSMLLGTQQAK